MKRRSLLALAAAAVAAAVPAAASAVMLWTLVASPLTSTVNQSTTFTLTATNMDLLVELGCLEVDLPGSFVIESLGTPTSSHGEDWASTQFGNSVLVRSLSGGGRLELGWSVTFTIRAHATVAGIYLWPNHAHQRQDCTSADQIGAPLSVTVLPAIVPTPTPTPTPTATASPTATPAPTATPSPILPLPSIGLPLPTLIPTVGPTPTPDPAATPDPTSRGSATPEPSTSPAESDGSGSTGAGPRSGGDGGTGADAAPALQVARGADQAGDEAGVGVELLGLLDADFVWLVPGASVAIPGLLVILWVVLQAVGALAWIPAVRRMADESSRRRS